MYACTPYGSKDEWVGGWLGWWRDGILCKLGIVCTCSCKQTFQSVAMTPSTKTDVINKLISYQCKAKRDKYMRTAPELHVTDVLRHATCSEFSWTKCMF